MQMLQIVTLHCDYQYQIAHLLLIGQRVPCDAIIMWYLIFFAENSIQQNN